MPSTNLTQSACVRTNLLPRFHALGLQTTRLPTTATASDPHIPILSTPNLSNAKRIILYLGEAGQDLGIFAYRTVGHESLAQGSCLDFAATAMKQDPSVAIVIANVGQLLWHRGTGRTMTLKTWSALPRKTGVSAGTRITEKNKIAGHATIEEHVGSVFDFVGSMMGEGAKLDVVGICEGIEGGMKFLDVNWEDWKQKVSAIAIGLGYVWDFHKEIATNNDFAEFVAAVSLTPV